MKKIIVSGSMQFLDCMSKCAGVLNANGFITILPEEDDWDSITDDEIDAYKAMVSRKHFDAISNEDTYAILVVNPEKKGKQNYIGANTFAEIAIAFYFKKKIFLLNDYYDQYVDELSGWGAVPLHGKIDTIQ